MLSICPIRKNQLVSGNWSIIIISDNGDGVPLAAQRDFILSVGPQSTSTVSRAVFFQINWANVVSKVFPTITATRTINPIVSKFIECTAVMRHALMILDQTITTTTTGTTFLNPLTVTNPSATIVRPTHPSCQLLLTHTSDAHNHPYSPTSDFVLDNCSIDSQGASKTNSTPNEVKAAHLPRRPTASTLHR
jgi:hypothetical protein